MQFNSQMCCGPVQWAGKRPGRGIEEYFCFTFSTITLLLKQNVNDLALAPWVVEKQKHKGLSTLQRVMLNVTKKPLTAAPTIGQS